MPRWKRRAPASRAAREIKALIVASVAQVDAGARQVDAAGRTMQEVVASVKKVSDLIAGIAAASREQSTGIEQVNIGVARMDQVVQQNAALVEEAAGATGGVKEQAALLLQLVSRFQVGEPQAPEPLPALAGAPRPALPGGAGAPRLDA